MILDLKLIELILLDYDLFSVHFSLSFSSLDVFDFLIEILLIEKEVSLKFLLLFYSFLLFNKSLLHLVIFFLFEDSINLCVLYIKFFIFQFLLILCDHFLRMNP